MKTDLKSAKRFGARYGAPLKDKLAKIESRQQKLQKCPSCKKIKGKRIAAGIYLCRSCGAKFTGGAYFLK